MRKTYRVQQSTSSRHSEEKRTQYIVVRKSMPIPLKKREANAKLVWGEFTEVNNSTPGD